MSKELDQFQELLDAGEYADAERHARFLIENQPNDLKLRIMLAKTLMFQDRYQPAYDLLSEISKQHHDNQDVFWLLAFCCENEKRFEEAIEALKKALNLGKRASLIHYNLGRLYNHYQYKSRNREVALRYLRYATTGDDPVPEAFVELARHEVGERAIYVLQNGLRRFPINQELHEKLCWRLCHWGRSTDCLEALARAEKDGVNPNHFHLISALALFRLREFTPALDNLNQLEASSDEVKHAVTCFGGVCRLESGELERAKDVLQRVIADDFSNTLNYAGHLVLICALLKLGNIEEAEAVFEEIPHTHRFFEPLFLSIFNFEDLEIGDYLTRTLDGLIESSTQVHLAAKARIFRGSYRFDDYTEKTREELLAIRDDLLAGIVHWPTDTSLNSRLSEVMVTLKDWLNAAKHHFTSVMHEPNEDIFSSMDEDVLEGVYSNQRSLEQFFDVIDTTIRDSYTRGRERFAKRSLEQLVEFFHSKKAYPLVIKVAEKFTNDELRAADVIFEVAYAYVETGNKKRGKAFYKAYLKDNGVSSAAANNLALLEEQSGNLIEAERLLKMAVEQDSSNEQAPRNLDRVKTELRKIEDQQRAMQKAADLYAHEDNNIRILIARLYAGRTKDELILCNPKKLAALLGTRIDKAEQRLSEFIEKRYFQEVTDSAISFHGKILRANTGLAPYLEEEIRAADEATYIGEVAANLASGSLDLRYGYNKDLIGSLGFVHSPDLSNMLERDLREAVTALITGSHKSALILCGSIAEAILLDQLIAQKDSAIKALQDIQTAAGEIIKSDDRRIERWTLDRLLDISLRLEIISTNLYHWGHGIRDFRNLVHPAAERRKAIEVSHENAQMAWNVVKRLIKEFSVSPDLAKPEELAMSARAD